jgi:hypothetical protein
MDTEKFSRWLTLGANLAVLASIVFLAIEIQQNTEMTRAEITQSRAEAAMSLAESTYNSEFMPDIWVKIREGQSLTASEEFRYRTWIRATLRNQENNLQQYNQGLLGEHMPRAISGVIKAVIVTSPLGLEYWEGAKHFYSDDFIEIVDSVIAESAEGPD